MKILIILLFIPSILCAGIVEDYHRFFDVAPVNVSIPWAGGYITLTDSETAEYNGLTLKYNTPIMYIFNHPKAEGIRSLWSSIYPDLFGVVDESHSEKLVYAKTWALTRQKMGLSPTNFLMVNDWTIREVLMENNLFVKDPLNCNAGIYAIYRYHQATINYQTDLEQFGVEEYWLYPYESIANGVRGDCDDFAVLLATFYLAAGVPEHRVRCVVGKSNAGYDHGTVYVLSDAGIWTHTDSTGMSYGATLADFKAFGDPTDGPGISVPWYSFNNKNIWEGFDNETL